MAGQMLPRLLTLSRAMPISLEPERVKSRGCDLRRLSPRRQCRDIIPHTPEQPKPPIRRDGKPMPDDVPTTDSEKPIPLWAAVAILAAIVIGGGTIIFKYLYRPP